MILITLTLIAVGWDYLEYRVPNYLIINGWMIGITSAIVKGGMQGVLHSIAGAILPIGILFLLFFFKVIGAGDIKLFSVLGCFVGIDIWQIMLYSFLVGGIIALFILIKSGELIAGVRNSFQSMIVTYNNEPSGRKMHFTLSILIGLCIYILLEGGVLETIICSVL